MTLLFWQYWSPEYYSLSLHDALPISARIPKIRAATRLPIGVGFGIRDAESARRVAAAHSDRKSTRLNSSHGYKSYAVFCLKKNSRTATLDNQRRRTACSSRLVHR